MIDSDLLNGLTSCFFPFSEAFGKLCGALQTVEGNKGRFPPGDSTADQVAKGIIFSRRERKKEMLLKNAAIMGQCLLTIGFEVPEIGSFVQNLKSGNRLSLSFHAFYLFLASADEHFFPQVLIKLLNFSGCLSQEKMELHLA